MSEDFYSLLGVSRNSSPSEIKQSYKKLARKYHPDNKETGSEEMFKKVGEAYSILSDTQKKAAYDRLGHEAFVKGAAGGSYGSHFTSTEIFDDLQDVFDTFFGGGFGASHGRRGGAKRRERGGDIQVILDLDFLEAAFGGTHKLSVNRMVTCKTCDGSGADPSVGVKTCPTCQGTGEVKKVTQSFLGMITQVSTCPTCSGTGTVNPVPCKTCNGKGKIKKQEDLEVKIPAGAENGSRLVWSHRGNDGRNGGPAGDLYILLKVKPHPKFKRQGLDIFEEVEINTWQAIMGDSIEVETIHGKEEVEIKSGTQPNTVLKLNSKGIKLDNGKYGDHHLKLKVVIPNKKELNKELIELIQEKVSPSDQKPSAGEAFANFFKKATGSD
ncbi:MAG: molecular chaperone DnaJ [Candidatus Caenarcaniphilales bacterium]|nr:molecular chaperone DnaJ [Candidatus Caenarcaniphilales bacterium]